MEDLSHILVPKMHVTEGFPTLPQEVMASFSDKENLDHATQAIGLTAEEADDAGS